MLKVWVVQRHSLCSQQKWNQVVEKWTFFSHPWLETKAATRFHLHPPRFLIKSTVLLQRAKRTHSRLKLQRRRRLYRKTQRYSRTSRLLIVAAPSSQANSRMLLWVKLKTGFQPQLTKRLRYKLRALIGLALLPYAIISLLRWGTIAWSWPMTSYLMSSRLSSIGHFSVTRRPHSRFNCSSRCRFLSALAVWPTASFYTWHMWSQARVKFYKRSCLAIYLCCLKVQRS